MSIKEIHENGTVTLNCPECGKEFIVDYDIGDDPAFADLLKDAYNMIHCQDCIEKRKERERAEEEAKRKSEVLETLPARLEQSGIPEFFHDLKNPLNRPPAEWIYQRYKRSLLISGNTGTYKTASACYVAYILMAHKGLSVKYYTRQELIAEYVNAKTKNKDGDGEYRFFSRISQYDLLIIDDFVQNRAQEKFSQSTQALFYSLIDGVYSGKIRTKIWILGRFFQDSMKKLFDDPDPLKRRIEERFTIAIFNTDSIKETKNL